MCILWEITQDSEKKEEKRSLKHVTSPPTSTIKGSDIKDFGLTEKTEDN